MVKKLFIALLFVLFSSLSAFADDPVLFFSDLTSGPYSGWNNSETQGAAITVWGLNLGESGSIVCGGQTLSSAVGTEVAEWAATDNNASLASGVTLERVTFFLNSSMDVGATNIQAVVSGVTSNSISFTVRNTGDIWYVDATNGNNANSGETNEGAWETYAYADCEENADVGPGDIVYIRAGTYDDLDAETALFLSEGSVDGTEANPIAYVGYPTEWPVFDFTSYDIFKSDNDTGSGDTRTDYIHFSKFYCSGGTGGAFFVWSNGFRLVGCYFDMAKEASQYTYTIRPVGADSQIIGNKFTGGGYDDYGHHVYYQAQVNAPGSSTDSSGTFAYNEVTGFDPDVAAGETGSSILNYRPNDTTGITFGPFYTHHNYIHDNPGAQLFYWDGEGSTGSVWTSYHYYNNLCTNNMTENTDNSFSCWIRLPVTFYIYSNTFYNCESDGGNGGALFHVVDYGAYEEPIVYMSNNIIYKSASGSYFSASSAEAGCSVTSTNDIYYSGSPKTDAEISYVGKIEDNPDFVNAGADNFTITEDSPAVNAAETSGVSNPSTDLFGRTWSNDIGVIGYYGASAPGIATNPTPSNNSVNISITQDLSWTNGSGVTDVDVYFEAVDSTPDVLVIDSGNSTITTYDTGTMEYSTTYYWQVNQSNAAGATTGNIWEFTTEGEPAGGGSTSLAIGGSNSVEVGGPLSIAF